MALIVGFLATFGLYWIMKGHNKYEQADKPDKQDAATGRAN
jgi:hypothetical protein